MAVVIPIGTAIIVMIVISGVYSTLTVLLAICTCCHCYHRKKYKISGRDNVPMRSGDGVLEVAAETGDPSMSWAGSGLSSTDSEGLPNQKEAQSREAQSSHNMRTGASGGRLPQGSGGVSGDPSRPSPQLLKHLVLPPIGHTQATPNHNPSSHRDYQMKTFHSHYGKEMVIEDIDGRSLEAAPAPASGSEGFRVLTVHKSTLKRKKPGMTETSLMEEGSKRGTEALYNPESTANNPPKLKHKKAAPRPPKPAPRPPKRPTPLKQIPKKPIIARTDSTKPLMEEDCESPTEPITQDAVWPASGLLEGQLVLENPVAEHDDRSPKSLEVLQEDLMEIITAL